ncbi:MAG: ATP-binding protein [Phycisphaerales bacterium JB052]
MDEHLAICVGEVIEVRGVKIILRMYDDANMDTLFYNGEKFRGVSIREFVAIRRGFREIVCEIEGEYLDERLVDDDGGKRTYVRKVQVRPIGYFVNGKFYDGIKYLPMIRDSAFLLSEPSVQAIFQHDDPGPQFILGKMLKEDLPVQLPWSRMFNSHLAIFGNTGSGKSNTLAKMFTELFGKLLNGIRGNSNFIVFDFNGEYTADQLVSANDKEVISLDTRSNEGDKYLLAENELWDTETLSLLFKATQNTQRPFLSRVVRGRFKFGGTPESLRAYYISIVKRLFSTPGVLGQALSLLREITTKLHQDNFASFLETIKYNSTTRTFYIDNDHPLGGNKQFANGNSQFYDDKVAHYMHDINIVCDDQFDELIIRSHLQLISDLLGNYVQFDHIQPLMKRMDSAVTDLKKVLKIGPVAVQEKLLTVVSMRKCNAETKKVLPLMIAKQCYTAHKEHVDNPPSSTLHLVIDEAHNILSQQSSREHESWRDYRLDLFEEIIKEGRKFGVFVVISSQRPADISPTIVSQIHNYFIHRLVNDKDLQLIENCVSTLDTLSRNMIPSLGKGACVATGTAFEIPLLLQVDLLDRGKQPDSEDIDLYRLWADG